MQLFSKKNAKIILAVLVAICLTGCATKAPVDEVVVAPVAPAPVVEETPVVEEVVSEVTEA
jgi:ABC-type Zn uptake system ZnuABC Zn-binding protein ZnuA